MKKISLFIVCAAMLLSLAACGSKGNGGENTDNPGASGAPGSPEVSEAPGGEDKNGDEMTLEEIFSDILKDVEDLPQVDNVAITEENFKNFLFINPIDGAEALASEGLISAIAHSAVLLRVPEGTDAEAVAEEIRTNADPRKWICVEAEKTAVTVHGRTILLVMSFGDTTDAITANFDALWK